MLCFKNKLKSTSKLLVHDCELCVTKREAQKYIGPTNSLNEALWAQAKLEQRGITH